MSGWIMLAVSADGLFKTANRSGVGGVGGGVGTVVNSRESSVRARRGSLTSLVVNVLLEKVNDRIDREWFVGDLGSMNDHVFK